MTENERIRRKKIQKANIKRWKDPAFRKKMLAIQKKAGLRTYN